MTFRTTLCGCPHLKWAETSLPHPPTPVHASPRISRASCSLRKDLLIRRAAQKLPAPNWSSLILCTTSSHHVTAMAPIGACYSLSVSVIRLWRGSEGPSRECETLERITAMGPLQTEPLLWCKTTDTQKPDDRVALGEGG